MQLRRLGWAGVEVESDGAALVVDPLEDPAAVFAQLGDDAPAASLPDLVDPEHAGRAVAGLVSHLHRDHADAGALKRALSHEALVCEPHAAEGSEIENLALAQASAELDAAEVTRREVAEWERLDVGPFTLTALPAVDGLGDPQISWLIEAEGKRILHLGDTLFHGYWWRIAQRHGPFDVVLAPINGAVVRFPHRRPSSPLAATLDPEQAALAGELLGARVLVPMHYDGFEIDPWYRPAARAESRFLEASADRSVRARVLGIGETLEP
jgi:L-ascorbate metabolism protein UlaG (beta-lactamase superfamily)